MASDKLVIVESPAKARTIGKILGGQYQIMASMGHIRDLPERTFGVDIENDFTPKYELMKGKDKVVKQLQAAAKGATEIYLAPDPDREGEAIAWHLQKVLEEKCKAEFHRATFHEITRSAIQRAFESVGTVNMDLVNAQQARRILDRLVGYQVSPLLWSRIEKGISAGRVQSVALRLVCEREREIQAFVPKEYWDFLADLEAERPGSGSVFTGKLSKVNGEKVDIGNGDDAAAAAAAIRGVNSLKILSNDVTPRKRYAPPPFITSTLQQAAGGIGLSASAAMRVAQQLYEGIDLGAGPVGLITYMRTDSVNVAVEAQTSCRQFIGEQFGPDYVPAKPNIFKSKSSAQEAHEAIRPTDVLQTPEKLRSFLDANQLRLYTLVWKRFVSSQMAPAQQQRTTIESEAAGADGKSYVFRTVATVTTFPGFTRVAQVASSKGDEEDGDGDAPAILAKLKVGDSCYLKELKTEQKFTEPPARYSEATLIRELESNGIGRPSTYATIVNTIQRRQYVLREKGRLIPSELGFNVNDFLVTSLPELFQVGFTAEMEARLDKVEEGDLDWKEMMQDFYGSFHLWVDDAKRIGSPEHEKATAMLELLGAITEWEKPRKVGRRTYNDERFFNSVKEKFAEANLVTIKQWEALLSMACKYSAQLPELNEKAEKFGFASELQDTREKVAAAEQRRKETTASSDEQEKLKNILSFFDAVEWEPPTQSRGRTFDDKKFFESFRKQVDGGRMLSPKQLGVLGRFATKYKETIGNFDELAKLLEIDQEKLAEQEAQAAEASKEVAGYLEQLAKIENWAEPQRKGRRTYDDRAFYESLCQQHERGKQLSSKQVFALKKLLSKYTDKE